MYHPKYDNDGQSTRELTASLNNLCQLDPHYEENSMQFIMEKSSCLSSHNILSTLVFLVKLKIRIIAEQADKIKIGRFSSTIH